MKANSWEHGKTKNALLVSAKILSAKYLDKRKKGVSPIMTLTQIWMNTN
jgi:hypothetical protein